MVPTINESVTSPDKLEPVRGLKSKRGKWYLLEHDHPANMVESGGFPWNDIIHKVIGF